MMSNPAPVAWIRGRFVDVPLTQELLEDAGVQSAEEWNDTAGKHFTAAALFRAIPGILRPRLRERFRILRWIFRLLRR